MAGPVLIIGAGIAGLAAARGLATANIASLVLDKGRGVGGRMATRRWKEAAFDHGAQFFSAKTPDFQDFVKKATLTGTMREWWPAIHDTVYPRWIGTAGMNMVPRLLSEQVTVLKEKKVTWIQPLQDGWQVTTDPLETFVAKALIITIPAPQALELLEKSQFPESSLAPLRQIAYYPCLSLMAILTGPSRIPAPGGMMMENGIVSWMADNFQKGISKKPSVTIHASPAFSQTYLDGDLQTAGKLMLEAVEQWIDAASVEFWQIHRWRYSLAYQRHPEPFWQPETPFPLLFGGDGFGAGNIEGAFVSGMAMAEKIKKVLG